MMIALHDQNLLLPQDVTQLNQEMQALAAA